MLSLTFGILWYAKQNTRLKTRNLYHVIGQISQSYNQVNQLVTKIINELEIKAADKEIFTRTNLLHKIESLDASLHDIIQDRRLKKDIRVWLRSLYKIIARTENLASEYTLHELTVLHSDLQTALKKGEEIWDVLKWVAN